MVIVQRYVYYGVHFMFEVASVLYLKSLYESSDNLCVYSVPRKN